MFPPVPGETERRSRLDGRHPATVDLEPCFDRVARAAADVFSAPAAAVMLVETGGLRLKGRFGLEGSDMPPGLGLCARAIVAGSMSVRPELREDGRVSPHPPVRGGPRLRFCAGAPLAAASGLRVGALCVLDTRPRAAAAPREEAQLAALAGLAVDLLEARRVEAANAAARGFADATQDGMLCIDAGGSITFANRAALDLFGYGPHEMVGRKLDLIMPERFRDAHAGGVARIAGGGPSRLDGKAVELVARKRSGEEFPVEIRICSWRDPSGIHMGANLRDISERKRRDQRLHRLAHQDPLTGLANRLRFEETLGRACEAAAPVALLLLDLDGFKGLNDSLGHAAGDAALQTLAVRLRTAVDGDALPARVGGDEFAVVLPGVGDPLAVRARAEAVLSAVEAPFRILGHSVEIGMSIGAAIGPQAGRDAEELIASADLALYRAKAQGGSSFRLYEPSMRCAVAAKRALQDEIIRAHERGEFVLHYQPQVRIDTGRLVGVEALLRWRHPERGLLLPGAFLPVLDRHMLALDVGTWILDEACRQAAAWRGGGPLRMAVNLFAAQVQRGSLGATTAAALARHGLRPAELELEVTERIALGNDERGLAPLRDVRALGVGLAFDDFGTGFAALSTLKRVPLTTLKIDRSFVQDILDDPHDAAVVACMVDMGRRLDLDVVAEGVETAEQEARLADLGCAVGQGFRYGRGVPAEAFAERWIASGAEVAGRGRAGVPGL